MDFAFYLDQLSLVMLLVVTGVGFLIHIYSVGYMWEEGGFYRFFAYLNLFMFFMLTLVLASNYLLMFIGWEGVGLASYLLIGFWFTKDSAASAGKKAFIVNRIGDFGFLIALFLLIKHFGSLNFEQVFQSVIPWPGDRRGRVADCDRPAADGRGRRQVGADSALCLAAGRDGRPDAGFRADSRGDHGDRGRVHGFAVACDLRAGADGLDGGRHHRHADGFVRRHHRHRQTDIKKVLAYSTVSQLGYMFMACGVGAFSAGIFHLMTHAFFKGLLFLAAGSVIHAVGGEQDMRRMGGLRRKFPGRSGP